MQARNAPPPTSSKRSKSSAEVAALRARDLSIGPETEEAPPAWPPPPTPARACASAARLRT